MTPKSRRPVTLINATLVRRKLRLYAVEKGAALFQFVDPPAVFAVTELVLDAEGGLPTRKVASFFGLIHFNEGNFRPCNTTKSNSRALYQHFRLLAIVVTRSSSCM